MPERNAQTKPKKHCNPTLLVGSFPQEEEIHHFRAASTVTHGSSGSRVSLPPRQREGAPHNNEDHQNMFAAASTVRTAARGV